MARRPHPIQRLERVLERLRAEVETEVGAGVAESGMLLSGIEVDVLDRGDVIAVLANVPGASPDDVEVNAEDGHLTIVARPRSSGSLAGDGDGSTGDGGDDGADGAGGAGDGAVEVLRRERPDRELKRTVRLPVPVVADEATASCSDGVLEIVLPKAVDGSDETTIDVE